MTQYAKLMDQIKAVAASVEEVSHAVRGFHLDVRLPGSAVRDVAQLLYEKEFYLVFVSAVHHASAIEVVYQYGHFETQYRIQVRADASSEGVIPSIADIFHGANWHERETKDFFGVTFDGHPNLQPLLLDASDAELKPLLKTLETVKPATALQWQPAESKKGNAPTKKVSKKDEN